MNTGFDSTVYNLDQALENGWVMSFSRGALIPSQPISTEGSSLIRSLSEYISSREISNSIVSAFLS